MLLEHKSEDSKKHSGQDCLLVDVTGLIKLKVGNLRAILRSMDHCLLLVYLLVVCYMALEYESQQHQHGPRIF